MLGNNALETLPYEIGFLTSLQELQVFNNPLIDPPYETISDLPAMMWACRQKYWAILNGPVPVVTATSTPPATDPATLLASEGIIVKQNLKDCFRCCLCQPNWQWLVTAYSPAYTEGMAFPTVMFVQEDSMQCPDRSWTFWAPVGTSFGL